ncbi:MAG: P63C domain-containing protein [Sphingomonas sp.]|uniref:P63C domain-containing protein n=1 Tax=Sphingomonas sp. TaxID=28214 RepID=UPI003567D781
MSKQVRGGLARAEKLTTEERREIAQKAANARWDRIKALDQIPSAETAGLLKIGDVELEVYVLGDKRRVISKRAMAKALRLKSQGGNAFMRTMTRKSLSSVVNEVLWNKIENPISFYGIRGESCDGFDAETLIEVCDILIEARNQNKLPASQLFLAMQSEFIVRSAAKIGIIALVDEATGYTDKSLDEYRKLFDKFVRSELRQWEKEFPDKFFSMIYRLYGLKRQKPDSTRHPQFFGNFIRKFVYYPLANSNGAILEKLELKNPVVYSGGGRRHKFFQYLSDEIGLDTFKQHLWQVVGIGEASTDKVNFERAFYRAFPEAMPKKNSEQMDFLSLLELR